MQVSSWVMTERGKPLAWSSREEVPGPGEVLVRVAGCGVCHTDLGFYFEGVPTRHALPLTLGHEISGRVVVAGPGAEECMGRSVVVPAVIPCGSCLACASGRGSVCPRQVFPGSDDHGGFGTHVKVPARGLCPVPDLSVPAMNPAGLDLASLSVIADAISTPYQAILQSGLAKGDLAVFVGVGGVGGFGAQVASTLGASVVAIDPSAERRDLLLQHGVARALDPAELDGKGLKAAIKAFAQEREIPSFRWKIFETSGTTAGQMTAWNLLTHGAHLAIVGFTPKPVEIRLSNVMAFDASVRGTWGCLPEHYPAVLELVLSGRVALAPFVEHRPMAAINDVLSELEAHRISRRVVLVPEA